MSNAWTGLDKKARKVKNIFVGVNNKAKKVVCAWVGVNGIAKYAYPEQIAIPTVSGTYTYTGNVQSAVVNYDSDNVTLSNTTATNAGTYTITAHLKYDYLRWADGSKTDKQIPWTIAKKVLDTPTPKYTFYYTGRNLGAKLFRSKYWNVYCDYSNEISVTNYTSGSAVGTYSVTFTINSNNYIFSGNKTSVTTSYSINKTNITLRYAYNNFSWRSYFYYEGESVDSRSSSSGYDGHLAAETKYYNSTGTYQADEIYLYASNDFPLGYGSLNAEDWELSRVYFDNSWNSWRQSNRSMVYNDFEAIVTTFQYNYNDSAQEALGILKLSIKFSKYAPAAGKTSEPYGFFNFFVNATNGTNLYEATFKAPSIRGFV